jgi:hypothetical protein
MGSKESIQLDRYIIETPHTAQECDQLFEQLYAMGYLIILIGDGDLGVQRVGDYRCGERVAGTPGSHPSYVAKHVRGQGERYDGKEEEFIHGE